MSARGEERGDGRRLEGLGWQQQRLLRSPSCAAPFHAPSRRAPAPLPCCRCRDRHRYRPPAFPPSPSPMSGFLSLALPRSLAPFSRPLAPHPPLFAPCFSSRLLSHSLVLSSCSPALSCRCLRLSRPRAPWIPRRQPS